MSEKPTLVYCKEHRTITSSRFPHLPKWCCEVAALEQQVEGYNELIMEVATKHEGETRHETARRYIYEAENRPAGEASQEEADLDKLTTQQKPTEEAMEETRSSADL